MVDDESGSLVSGLTQVERLGDLLHGVLFGAGTRLLGEQFAFRGIRHVGRQYVPIAEHADDVHFRIILLQLAGVGAGVHAEDQRGGHHNAHIELVRVRVLVGPAPSRTPRPTPRRS